MRRILILLFALCAATAAHAQGTLLQGGPWAPGRAPMYVGQGSGQAVVQDSGPAGGGAAGTGLSELGITARGSGTAPFVGQGTGPFGTNVCDFDAPITNAAGYHFLCFSANASQGSSTGGLISYGAGGTASALPLQMCINGSCFVPGSGGGGGSGTVTSVGFTGGLISVATPTTTPALTVAGTSGGIPYFNSASTWASSGALTANLPVIGGGPGNPPSVGSRGGNTTVFGTVAGSLTNGHCVSIDVNGNFIDAGGACTTGGGGGTVNSATAGQIAYYATTGTADRGPRREQVFSQR